MSDYSALQSTMDAIVTEAIDWAMSDAGWYPSGGGYLLSGPYAWAVPGPEAGNTGPVVFHEPRSGADVSFDFWSTVYSPLTASVHALFQPWRDMPKPEEFRGSIAQALEATKKLSAGEEVNGVPVTPNDKLGAIDSASGDLSQLAGETVNAFRWRYVDRLDPVLRGQAGAAATLTELVAAEAAIWGSAQRSVASVADCMLAAMKARAGGSADVVLSVAGVVLSIGSALATGGLSVALSAAGAVSGAAAGFTGDEDRPPLSGSSAADVIASARGVLAKLDGQIRSEEGQLGTKARSAGSDLDDPTYDLGVPVGFYRGDDEQDYTKRGSMVALQADRLRSVAKVHLPLIAHQLHASAAALSAADDYSAWSRSSLGLAPCGAHDDWVALRELVIDFLVRNEKACHDAADQLLIAAGFVGDTDEQVSRELRHHTDEVRQSNVPQPAPHMQHPGMEPI